MAAAAPLPAQRSDRLARRLGTGDAVVVGLGAMIGAGVFSAFAPAARTAGAGLLLALALAALVAYANASSSAALAAVYPSSGGTYVYGRERLGDRWGFLAGFGFVAGKSASCAAMALTFASYAWPAHARPLAGDRNRRARRCQPGGNPENRARHEGNRGGRPGDAHLCRRSGPSRWVPVGVAADAVLRRTAPTGSSRQRASSSSHSRATPESRLSARR